MRIPLRGKKQYKLTAKKPSGEESLMKMKDMDVQYTDAPWEGC